MVRRTFIAEGKSQEPEDRQIETSAIFRPYGACVVYWGAVHTAHAAG